jgi:flagellar basal-body rod protein FlgB
MDRPLDLVGRGSAVVLDSVSSLAMRSALDGLALRQRVTANNIANVNTPGFHARRVSFEDALARSVSMGGGSAQATTETSLEPTRLNGSNVNLDTETLSNIDTVLRFQFAARAVEGPFTSIRTALRTS